MIYVHVPFCKSFCTYCGFYSELCGRSEKAFDAYTGRVCAEIGARREEIKASSEVDTLYFGGGTPSVLPPSCIRRIVEALPFPVGHAFREFTVEMNPDDVTAELITELRGIGVGRISLGIQSFDDGILRWMNRRHTADAAVKAVETIRACGIDNVSIDLIFGLPQLEDGMWEKTLDKALDLHPEHISAYQLSVEEGSALEKMIADGRFTEAGQEQCRRQYDCLCARLRAAGYNHYEVSNFALPGREAVHNGAYWSRAPYVGLGPGAHSFDGAFRRSWNGEMERDGSWASGSEELSAQEVAEERLMLALRTAAGLPQEELRSIIGPCALQDALSKGLLAATGGTIRIPEDHFFVSDDIISSLIP